MNSERAGLPLALVHVHDYVYGWALAIALLGSIAAPGAAQDADSIGFADSAAPATQDADELGFGDTPSPPPAAAATPQPSAPSPWTVSATLRIQSAVRLETSEPSRLAKFRQVLEARIEWQNSLGSSWQLRALASARTEADYAVLMNLDAYSPPDIDVYAWQLLPRETYLSLSSKQFELRFGEQIVNLGQGEILSVLDVVNPRDLREPLLADPAELRMPVLMTRLSGTLGALRADAIVVHEPYFGLTAPPLSEFSPFRKLLLDAPVGRALAGRSLTTEHIPGRDLSLISATQIHGRISWTGPDVDLALSASSLLDPLGVPSLPPPAAFDRAEIGFPVLHPRYAQFGHSGAWTAGAFVVRWELAFEYERSIALRTRNDPLLRLSSVRRSGLRGLAGLTYVPSASTNAGLELVQGYVFDNPDRSPGSTRELLFPLEAPQIALRFTQRFLHDRASLSALGVVIGVLELNAWVARLELSYALFDRVEVTVGCVTYHPTTQFGFFYGFTQHDRVFADLRWDLF